MDPLENVEVTLVRAKYPEGSSQLLNIKSRIQMILGFEFKFLQVPLGVLGFWGQKAKP